VDRARFGGLRERQQRRTDVVRAAPRCRAQRMLQRIGRDLAGFAGKAHELDSTAVEFRRAAFVHRDVRFVMAEYGAPKGGVRCASALAAVPVGTRKTATSRANTSVNCSSTRLVQTSCP